MEKGTKLFTDFTFFESSMRTFSWAQTLLFGDFSFLLKFYQKLPPTTPYSSSVHLILGPLKKIKIKKDTFVFIDRRCESVIAFTFVVPFTSAISNSLVGVNFSTYKRQIFSYREKIIWKIIRLPYRINTVSGKGLELKIII